MLHFVFLCKVQSIFCWESGIFTDNPLVCPHPWYKYIHWFVCRGPSSDFHEHSYIHSQVFQGHFGSLASRWILLMSTHDQVRKPSFLAMPPLCVTYKLNICTWTPSNVIVFTGELGKKCWHMSCWDEEKKKKNKNQKLWTFQHGGEKWVTHCK